jgi:hypothetical protein
MLADSFNGAEAVRQACSSVYIDALMTPIPQAVGDIETRLAGSDLFLRRVGIPARDEPIEGAVSHDHLVNVIERMVRPAPPGTWLVAAADCLGAKDAPLVRMFDLAVADLFPQEDNRRFIPAHAPPPLSLQWHDTPGFAIASDSTINGVEAEPSRRG